MADLSNKDMAIGPGLYAHVQDLSKGEIRTEAGPTRTQISNTDQPVKFDAQGKFQPCSPEAAILPYVMADENSYVVLHSPAEDRSEHPTAGKSNSLPPLSYGKRIVIAGPTAFALWPGQVASVVKGHTMRSNEFVIVQVYNQDAARDNWSKQVLRKAAGQAGEGQSEALLSGIDPATLVVGQKLVIKGTEVSFYMPVTGLEVVPDESGKHVRSAVTVERLQYCRLISESGNERIEKGPQVVFPFAEETFDRRTDAKAAEDARVYQAIELNPQMGIHVKVTADYKEGEKDFHEGDELFITGKDQRIYFPRPEHSIIKYGGKDRVYAITVPVGKAYYVLDKDKGKIELVKGPCILLPNPINQVVVRRVLDADVVGLYFPGNDEAGLYNEQLRSLRSASALGDQEYLSVESVTSLGARTFGAQTAMRGRVDSGQIGAATFDRGTAFTPPRSITLDDKFGGAVGITVWPGYAVQVVSKDGSTRVVVGHAHTLLEFDEALTVMRFSTGNPKSDGHPMRSPYLKVRNNRVSDTIEAETRDMVKVRIAVAYQVNFEGEDQNAWFTVSDYVQLLSERMRSIVRAAIKDVNIEELINRSASLVRDAILGKKTDGTKRTGYSFDENHMHVTDVEVLSAQVADQAVSALLQRNQQSAVELSLKVTAAEAEKTATERLELALREKGRLQQETALVQIELAMAKALKEKERDLAQVTARAEVAERMAAASLATATAEEAVAVVKRATRKAQEALELETDQARQALELEELAAQVEAAVKKFAAISPELVAAITAVGDKTVASNLAEALAPVALVQGVSVKQLLATLLPADSAIGQMLQSAFNAAQANVQKD